MLKARVRRKPRAAPPARLLPRKAPRQERALFTVEAILRATAHIFRTQGPEAASTNRIAQVAGVSIGSLYQYFPSRDAVVAALLEQHVLQFEALLARALERLGEATLEQVVRLYIHSMLEAHAVDPKLHSALTVEGLRVGGFALVSKLNASTFALVERYLEANRALTRKLDAEQAAFILVTAVEAVAHWATLGATERLKSRSFEEELCQLVLRYLAL